MKKLISRLRYFTETVRKELQFYKLVLGDSRTPVLPKLILVLTLGYLLSPFDLIPDFIPVLGQLDDVVIVPALIYFSLRLIPESIIKENRRKINELNTV